MKRSNVRQLIRFLKREEGVTAVECAIMLAVVVVICLVVLAPIPPDSDAPPTPRVVLEQDPL